MEHDQGIVKEIFSDGAVRIECLPGLIPAPGQYLQAYAPASDSPLADSVFLSRPASDGFIAASNSVSWAVPGALLNLRGPLGKGFSLPGTARKIALASFDFHPSRLLGLIQPVLKQGAELVLLCDTPVPHLPEAVEVQPLKALPDILHWADYAALDIPRESMDRLKEELRKPGNLEIQVLVFAPMPCAGLAECGACAVAQKPFWKMACKDGPVFQWDSLK